MLFRKRDRNKLKLYGYFTLAVILISSAIVYYLQIPKPLHWTLAVPWGLSVLFFGLWRWKARSAYIPNGSHGKKKIKRYT